MGRARALDKGGKGNGGEARGGQEGRGPDREAHWAGRRRLKCHVSRVTLRQELSPSSKKFTGRSSPYQGVALVNRLLVHRPRIRSWPISGLVECFRSRGLSPIPYSQMHH